MIVVAAF